ncbi:hypothetical protein BJX63DRAFT_429227 [Aspergillus granulosus]|uniref:Heterokaryon incompatibility domain-containing protein n=1 Tax=Aspergillus granulosus TaxID=176169 RepID=A0ABR4HT36_9EURO
MRQMIDRVCYFLDRNCTISKKRQIKGQTRPAACPWPVSDEVATSIIALGSTLRQAAITYWEIPRLGSDWTAGSSRILKAALEAKYCRSAVAFMMEDLPIDGHYYLAAGEGHGEAYLAAHKECSEVRCVARVNEDVYETRHAPRCIDETCRISFGSPSSAVFIESVVKVIDGGGTPIIYCDQDTKRLTVEEYNPEKGLEPRYVSISHLSRIQGMINALDIPEQGSGHTRIGFWMDTLCIPVGHAYKQQKKASIRKMRQIYKAASAVLVLDAWMQSTYPSASSIPIERCARLYSSNWIRRLWTLQEGALNRNVFLQWNDKAETLEALANARIAWEEEAQGRGDIVEMIANEEMPAEMRAMLYLPLCDVMGPRATTRESDETLCLSTVLGLDPKLFLDIENGDGKGGEEDTVQRRMEAFLRTLGEFNAGLIFSEYRKLERDGVRWAPRSLLRHRTADLGPVFLSDQTGKIEQVGQFSGLAVRFPGFLIRASSRLASSRRLTVSLAGDNDRALDAVLGQEGCRGFIGHVQAGMDHQIDGEDIVVIRYQCGVTINKREANVQTEEIGIIRGLDAQWLVQSLRKLRRLLSLYNL